MLTKNLIKYTYRSNRVYPKYINVEDSALLALAQKMLDAVTQNVGNTQVLINEIVSQIVQESNNTFLANGLKKLIIDRCEFHHPTEFDWQERRRKIFLNSTQLLDENKLEHPQQLHTILLKGDQTPLYIDLPHHETLKRIKTLYPTQLLQRYNVAQVQGLLFNSRQIVIKTKDSNPANLRRLFHYLKFFRLLASIKREKDEKIITIDGPLNILDSVRKYGLQLASFFPAICLLELWELHAEVEVKKDIKDLILTEKSGYVSHYQHLGAYVPEEVRLFAKHFKEKVEDWIIKADSPFLSSDNNEIIFPDFTFVNKKGKEVYLELFHRWHRGSLLPRLRQCIAKGEKPLVLGIDTALLKGELKDLLESGLLPQHRYFTFRDYPVITKVRKCLKHYSD